MRRINSVLIAGAGAVGLAVADTFYAYDPACAAILAGGERLERYRKNGLWINGGRRDFRFAEAGNAGINNTGAAFDLIIVASKFYHLEQIIADMRPYVGEKTIIVSLINGISSEEILDKAFPANNTAAASMAESRLPLAMILGTDAQHAGGKTNFTRRGVVHFGDANGKGASGDGPSGERDGLVAEFFTRSGLPFEHHPRDMKRALWYKFMINVGANQTSALLGFPYGPFKKDSPLANKEAQEILESAMREVISIANAEGIGLDESDVASWYATVATLNDNGYTSMCQDILAKRKMELELFGYTVIQYGKKHGIATPVNETLYRALRAIERNYSRE